MLCDKHLKAIFFILESIFNNRLVPLYEINNENNHQARKFFKI